MLRALPPTKCIFPGPSLGERSPAFKEHRKSTGRFFLGRILKPVQYRFTRILQVRKESVQVRKREAHWLRRRQKTRKLS